MNSKKMISLVITKIKHFQKSKFNLVYKYFYVTLKINYYLNINKITMFTQNYLQLGTFGFNK